MFRSQRRSALRIVGTTERRTESQVFRQPLVNVRGPSPELSTSFSRQPVQPVDVRDGEFSSPANCSGNPCKPAP